MNGTQTNSLFTEITAEESASINGAYYYRPRWWYHRPYYSYRPYRHNNSSTTVNVRVNVDVDS